MNTPDDRDAAIRILLREGVLSSEDLIELDAYVAAGEDVVTAACSCGADPREIASAFSRSLGIPVVELGRPDVELIELLGLDFVHQQRVLPLVSESESVILAMTNPVDSAPAERARMWLEVPVEPRVVANTDLDALLADHPLPEERSEHREVETHPAARMALLACLDVIRSGEAATVTVGIRHPDDAPPVFDDHPLPPEIARSVIEHLREMTGVDEAPVGYMELRIGGAGRATMEVAFSRDDSVATLSLIERHPD